MEAWARTGIRHRDMEEQVPQPLLASLSLRNSWLLPGYWNHNRLFGGGVQRVQKPKCGSWQLVSLGADQRASN
jgi:hypothetical protein